MPVKVPASFGFFAFALFLSLFSGCAYLNTFYNGKTAFSTARMEHEKLLRTNADSIGTLPQTIIAGYDTALSKSLKVIQTFPKEKDWHDDAVLLIGKSLYYKGEYTRATRRFRQLIDEYPQSKLIPEAFLYLARSLVKDENFTSAEAVCAQILAKYPQVNKRQDVSLLLAEIAKKRGSSAMALTVLLKALSLAKDDEQRMSLSAEIGRMHLSVSQFPQARQIVQKSPRNQNFKVLLFALDTIYMSASLSNGSYLDVLQKTRQMRKTKNMFSYTGEILYFEGAALSKLGKTDTAMIVFEKITKLYPSTPRCGLVWYALGEMHQQKKNFFRAGECYAKAALLLKDPVLAGLAKQKSSAITQIGFTEVTKDTLKKIAKAPLEKDSTGMRLFRIGELFWNSLAEPDSAYHYFMRLVTDTTLKGDSIAKAYYAAGYIALLVKKDSTLADSVFSALMKRYPVSEYVKESQRLREIPVTVMTREDSAAVAFALAEKALFSKDSAQIDLAADRYYEVYRQFPKTSVGAKALFCAAWTNDFILEKNKSALKLYEEICDSFPLSVYCSGQARQRIQTVADTIRVRKAQKKIDDAKKLRENPVSGATVKTPVKSAVLGASSKNKEMKADSNSVTPPKDSIELANIPEANVLPNPPPENAKNSPSGEILKPQPVLNNNLKTDSIVNKNVGEGDSLPR